MTAATYTPQPGTIPARAVAFLQTLPPGTEMQSGPLADALGVGISGFGSWLDYAVRNGAISCVKREGRLYWSLGRGERARSESVDEEPDDAPPVQRTVKAQPGSISLTDVPAWPGLDIDAGSALAPKIAPLPASKASKGQRQRAKTATATPPACQDSNAKPVRAITPYQRTAGPQTMRVALWSDGQLQIQRGDFELILLAPEETKQLVHYLERMGESAQC